MEERKLILQFLRKSSLPLKTGDIEKGTGLDRNTVQKVLNELSIEGILSLDRCFNKVINLEGGKNE